MALEALKQYAQEEVGRIIKRDAPKQPTMKKYKPDNAIPLLRKENATEALQERLDGVYKERHKSFSQWLLKHPLDLQTLKENRPADYRELLQLYDEIDRHWLKEDLYSFLKAIEAYQTAHLRIMPAISELTKRQEDFLKWLAPEKTFEETKSYWKEGKANRTTVYRWIKNLISLGYIDETSLGYKVIRNTAVVPALPEPEKLINFMQQCNNTAKTVENSKSELLQYQMQQYATKQQQMQQNMEQNFNLLQCCTPLQSTMQQSKSSIDKDLSQPVALLHGKNNKEHKPEGTYLDRDCVICGSDNWLILKPDSAISAIQCLNCNHIELHVNQRPKKKYSSN